MDTILTLQEQIKLLAVDVSKTDNHIPDYNMGGYYGGHSYYDKFSLETPKSRQLEDDISEIQETMSDLWEEIEEQFENELNRADFKAVLHGIKNTIINQLGKGNSRKWRKWEENASMQSIHRSSLYDYFNHYRQEERLATKPGTVQTKTTVSTSYNYRPKKTLKWELVIKEEVGTFIKKMMALNKSCEWGVAFTWILDKEAKQVIIDRIYIMPVEQGGAHVRFVNESEYIIFADISELGEFVTDLGKDRFAGIMHSHHNMGSWHSSTDHGTIATYINDFKSVLSLVWAWKGGDSKITVDAILKTKKDGFLLDNIVFENEINSNDKDIEHIDNELVDKYNEMVKIVVRDQPKYKIILEQFEKTKKFLSIEKLYNVIYDEDNNDQTKQIIKELIKH